MGEEGGRVSQSKGDVERVRVTMMEHGCIQSYIKSDVYSTCLDPDNNKYNHDNTLYPEP